MSVHKICCIIDFDGFTVRSWFNGQSKPEFLIREIGYVRMHPEFGDFLPQSYRFDLTTCDISRCKGDVWYTIHHQTRYITGLSFKPEPGEKVEDYAMLHSIILKIYRSCRQQDRNVVAFKGGDSEKEILDELGIPNLDLRKFGCPKYEDIVERKMVYSHLIDCGYHGRIDKDIKLPHCPRAEVTAFRDWLMVHDPVWTVRSCGDLCQSTEDSSLPSSSAGCSSDASSS